MSSLLHHQIQKHLLFSRVICFQIEAMSYCSSSLRSFTARIPISLHQTNSLIGATKPTKNPSFFRRPINFRRIYTRSLSTLSVSASASSSMDLQPVEELPPKLQEIVKLFQSVQEPKAKYEQLLFYGKNLKPLDAQFKTSKNKVEGCVSQVWVRAYLDEDKNVFYEADSDSVLTKGLAALLVQGLSGRSVQEVIRVSPDFAVLLGLQQSLTPSRNNGFLNMLRLMQKKALELSMEAEKGEGTFRSSSPASREDGGMVNSSAGVSENPEGSSESENRVTSSNLGSSANGSNSSGLGNRGKRIREKLEKELSPVELQVEDVSHQHAGHAGVRGSDGETHFNVRVVSKAFDGKSLVKRHRLIYDLLQDELQTGLHALSIVAKMPSEVGAR